MSYREDLNFRYRVRFDIIKRRGTVNTEIFRERFGSNSLSLDDTTPGTETRAGDIGRTHLHLKLEIKFDERN